VRFGPDGKLYVGLGEQTAGAPSQKLDSLLGKILRLNPDGTIPEDNPFYTQTTGKYRAIWAYGIRNPFGLAVQPETGRMFCTDVGGSAFEEVNEIVRGGNYGWPESEGYTDDARFKSPLHAFPPVIGRSVTGGVFYPADVKRVESLKGLNGLNEERASNAAGLTIQRFNDSTFPAPWAGKFFFADWHANWVKALDPESPTNVVTFAKGLNAPVATELAADGSLLVLNRGTIWRDGKKFKENAGSLVRIRYVGEGAPVAKAAPRPARGTEKNALGLPGSAYDLPRHLSELGLEMKLGALAAQGRALDYAVNVPEWHPGIDVQRSIVLPPGGTISFRAESAWHFPAGTVFLRHYRVAGGGAPSDLELRLMMLGDMQGYGASYRYRPGAEDAELVEDGELVSLAAHGASGARVWFFPPADDALTHPTAGLVHAVDANTRQLNRSSARGENQLATWNGLGVFEPPLRAGELAALPKFAALEDASVRPEQRVRSYLDVHCAVCHQPGGASRGLFDARFGTPLEQTGILNGELAAGDLGIPGAKVVVPGDPAKSILLERLKRHDQFRMPPVQFHGEISPLVPLLEAWIRGLAPPAASSK
jgi:hypothetical protein